MKKVLVIGVLMALGLSSCSLFRSKNKCNTCPTWSYNNMDSKERNNAV